MDDQNMVQPAQSPLVQSEPSHSLGKEATRRFDFGQWAQAKKRWRAPQRTGWVAAKVREFGALVGRSLASRRMLGQRTSFLTEMGEGLPVRPPDEYLPLAGERRHFAVPMAAAESQARSWREVSQRMRGELASRSKPRAPQPLLPRATRRASQSRVGQGTGPTGAAGRLAGRPVFVSNPKEVRAVGHVASSHYRAAPERSALSGPPVERSAPPPHNLARGYPATRRWPSAQAPASSRPSERPAVRRRAGSSVPGRAHSIRLEVSLGSATCPANYLGQDGPLASSILPVPRGQPQSSALLRRQAGRPLRPGTSQALPTTRPASPTPRPQRLAPLYGEQFRKIPTGPLPREAAPTVITFAPTVIAPASRGDNPASPQHDVRGRQAQRSFVSHAAGATSVLGDQWSWAKAGYASLLVRPPQGSLQERQANGHLLQPSSLLRSAQHAKTSSQYRQDASSRYRQDAWPRRGGLAQHGAYTARVPQNTLSPEAPQSFRLTNVSSVRDIRLSPIARTSRLPAQGHPRVYNPVVRATEAQVTPPLSGPPAAARATFVRRAHLGYRQSQLELMSAPLRSPARLASRATASALASKVKLEPSADMPSRLRSAPSGEGLGRSPSVVAATAAPPPLHIRAPIAGRAQRSSPSHDRAHFIGKPGLLLAPASAAVKGPAAPSTSAVPAPPPVGPRHLAVEPSRSLFQAHEAGRPVLQRQLRHLVPARKGTPGQRHTKPLPFGELVLMTQPTASYLPQAASKPPIGKVWHPVTHTANRGPNVGPGTLPTDRASHDDGSLPFRHAERGLAQAAGSKARLQSASLVFRRREVVTAALPSWHTGAQPQPGAPGLLGALVAASVPRAARPHNGNSAIATKQVAASTSSAGTLVRPTRAPKPPAVVGHSKELTFGTAGLPVAVCGPVVPLASHLQPQVASSSTAPHPPLTLLTTAPKTAGTPAAEAHREPPSSAPHQSRKAQVHPSSVTVGLGGSAVAQRRSSPQARSRVSLPIPGGAQGPTPPTYFSSSRPPNSAGASRASRPRGPDLAATLDALEDALAERRLAHLARHGSHDLLEVF
jgi:hypothetical protein